MDATVTDVHHSHSLLYNTAPLLLEASVQACLSLVTGRVLCLSAPLCFRLCVCRDMAVHPRHSQHRRSWAVLLECFVLGVSSPAHTPHLHLGLCLCAGTWPFILGIVNAGVPEQYCCSVLVLASAAQHMSICTSVCACVQAHGPPSWALSTQAFLSSTAGAFLSWCRQQYRTPGEGSTLSHGAKPWSGPLPWSQWLCSLWSWLASLSQQSGPAAGPTPDTKTTWMPSW